MSKSINISIDLSGSSMDEHGEVETTPKIQISSRELSTVEETKMLQSIHEAVIKIVKPKSCKEQYK